MELLVDKSHKRANVSKLKSPIKFAISALGGLGLLVFSGCGAKTNEIAQRNEQALGQVTTTLDETTTTETTTTTESTHVENHERDSLIVKDIDPEMSVMTYEEFEDIRESNWECLDGTYFYPEEGTTIKVKDLQNIKKAIIRTHEDYSWINYCSNLESMEIFFEPNSSLIGLKEIHGKNLPKLHSLEIGEPLGRKHRN